MNPHIVKLTDSLYLNLKKNEFRNPLWEVFYEKINYYKSNKFRYKILYNDNNLVFKEYSGRKLIRELVIDDSLTLALMQMLQFKVMTFIELKAGLISSYKNNDIDLRIEEILCSLKNEGLIYYHTICHDITIIININQEYFFKN